MPFLVGNFDGSGQEAIQGQEPHKPMNTAKVIDGLALAHLIRRYAIKYPRPGADGGNVM
jgi:hypothetical protein